MQFVQLALLLGSVSAVRPPALTPVHDVEPDVWEFPKFGITCPDNGGSGHSETFSVSTQSMKNEITNNVKTPMSPFQATPRRCGKYTPTVGNYYVYSHKVYGRGEPGYGYVMQFIYGGLDWPSKKKAVFCGAWSFGGHTGIAGSPCKEAKPLHFTPESLEKRAGFHPPPLTPVSSVEPDVWQDFPLHGVSCTGTYKRGPVLPFSIVTQYLKNEILKVKTRKFPISAQPVKCGKNHDKYTLGNYYLYSHQARTPGGEDYLIRFAYGGLEWPKVKKVIFCDVWAPTKTGEYSTNLGTLCEVDKNHLADIKTRNSDLVEAHDGATTTSTFEAEDV